METLITINTKERKYIMHDYNIEQFLSEEGYISLGNEMYKCPEGDIHHIDHILDLFNEIMADLQNC